MARVRYAFLVVLVVTLLGVCPAFALADSNESLSSAVLQVDGDSGEQPETPVASDISQATVTLPKKSFVCTGKRVEPVPTVSFAGAPLALGVDYSVKYGSNQAVGRGTVRVVGMNGFTGAAEKTFAITPPKAAISNVKSTAARKATVRVRGIAGVQGYQYKIGTGSNASKGAIVKNSGKRAFTFSGLEEGGSYTVKVRAYADIDGKRYWGDWSKAKPVKVLHKEKWLASGGYYSYQLQSGKLAHGLKTIKGKTYLFDSSGRQKTGWQHYKGGYRFFNVANKSGGSMVTRKVVNGIKLGKDGVASYSPTGLEELKIMVKAQKLAERITVPSQSKRTKLTIGFDWMLNNCNEAMLHQFGSYAGWHRVFANEIYDLNNGSCFSYGAAFAYYANAVGYQSCRIVSSGGHGWAEIDGDVYDIEWTRHNPNRYFAWPYSWSGRNGSPGYASARIYVVQIAPKTSRW